MIETMDVSARANSPLRRKELLSPVVLQAGLRWQTHASSFSSLRTTQNRVRIVIVAMVVVNGNHQWSVLLRIVILIMKLKDGGDGRDTDTDGLVEWSSQCA